MKKKENIVSYTMEEIKGMIARGEDKTDWEKFRNMTKEEMLAVCDEDDMVDIDWNNVVLVHPAPKKEVHIRLDADLLAWLKQSGKGYQTRINSILRSYMQANVVK